MQDEKNLGFCLSFGREDETAKTISNLHPNPKEADHDHDHEHEDDDFEFSFTVKDHDQTAADEIFSNGQIRPVYPVFNRDLLLTASSSTDVAPREKAIRLPLRRLFIEEERENTSFSSACSSSSSETDELEGLAPGSYCVWNPKTKKSNSTGSSLRLKLRDLVLGRSQSDGKDKFVFLAPKEKVAEKEKEKKVKKVKEMDVVTAHRMYYGKERDGKGSGRKSFLPYRQDSFGFLANVNGLARSHRPF